MVRGDKHAASPSDAIVCEGLISLFEGWRRGYSLRHVYLFNFALVVLRGPHRSDLVDALQLLTGSSAAVVCGRKKTCFAVDTSSSSSAQTNGSTILRSLTSWKTSSPAEAQWWMEKVRSTMQVPTTVVVDDGARDSFSEIDATSSVSIVDEIDGVATTVDRKKSLEATVFVRISAIGLANMDDRTGTGLFGKSDPYFQIVDDITGDMLYESATIPACHDPEWSGFSLPLTAIFGRLLRFKVWDRDEGKSDFLGEVGRDWHSLVALEPGSRLPLSGADHVKGSLVIRTFETRRPTTLLAIDPPADAKGKKTAEKTRSTDEEEDGTSRD